MVQWLRLHTSLQGVWVPAQSGTEIWHVPWRPKERIHPDTPYTFHSSPNIHSEFSSTLFASPTSTPFPFTHQNHTLHPDLDAHLLTRAWPNKEGGWLSHLKNTAKVGTLGKKINRRPQSPGFSVACEPKLFLILFQFSSAQFSHSILPDSLQPHELQHARLFCASPTPGAYSNAYPLSQWCHPTTSSSVVPFSSRLQSFPTLGSFHISQFFAWGGQSIEISGWCKSSIPYPKSIHTFKLMIPLYVDNLTIPSSKVIRLYPSFHKLIRYRQSWIT